MLSLFYFHLLGGLSITEYISNVITRDKVSQWQAGDVHIISAGTGVGKTTFVHEVLCAYAAERGEKVLMLESRSAVKEQQRGDAWRNQIDNLRIGTYQYDVQDKLLDAENKSEVDLSEYAYIVCDECHYFISDAWNSYTDLSFNTILKQTPNAIKVLMSATGDDVYRFINREGIPIASHRQFDTSYKGARSMQICDKWRIVQNQISDSIKRRIKTIIFVESAVKAYDLYEPVKTQALFVTSDKRYKNVCAERQNKQWYKNMCKRQTFEPLLLITTMKMEVGFNLKDVEIQRIIVSVADPYKIKQCLGRKRMDGDNDLADVLVHVDGQAIGGRMQYLKKQVDATMLLHMNRYNEALEKYGRNYHTTCGHMIYSDADASLRVNKLALYGGICELNRLRQISNYKASGKMIDGYAQVLLTLLECNVPITKAVDQELQLNLQQWAEESRLFAGRAEQKRLAKRINATNENGRQFSTTRKINEYLSNVNWADGASYRIEVINLPKRQTAWKVVEDK